MNTFVGTSHSIRVPCTALTITRGTEKSARLARRGVPSVTGAKRAEVGSSCSRQYYFLGRRVFPSQHGRAPISRAESGAVQVSYGQTVTTSRIARRDFERN